MAEPTAALYQKSPASLSASVVAELNLNGRPGLIPVKPVGPVAPVEPVAPVGTPKAKSKVAALVEPEFVAAAVADPPTPTVLTEVEPTSRVAAAPTLPDLANEIYRVSEAVSDPPFPATDTGILSQPVLSTIAPVTLNAMNVAGVPDFLTNM